MNNYYSENGTVLEHGFKIKNIGWIGLYQQWLDNGTRSMIDQNKNGSDNGPKVRFKYAKQKED